MHSQKSVTENSGNLLGSLIRYLIPGIISMTLLAVYSFTDTFVVGQKMGAVAIGAMGICTPALTVTYALGFWFGMGGASLYSISTGQGRRRAQAAADFEKRA